MTALFRPSQVSCFFCQEHISPVPRDPRSFRCPHCTCWNRFDRDGEILSDEPAMHDEALNARSFAKRASPTKDRFPTMYAGTNKSIFCHTCQTNQMLLTNLLSNYLPQPEDPSYERRLEMLPDYRNSLHVRYPPVCDKCQPAVDEEIRTKDHMARTKALGGWLKQSKGKEKQRKVSAAGKQRDNLVVELAAWRFRGGLWCSTLMVVLVGNATAAFGFPLPSQMACVRPVLPGLALLSILWTFWDPTYSAFRKAQIQGRDVRVHGKNIYIILQMLSWLSRSLTSSLLAILYFRPHQDYLQLSHLPLSSRSRLYFSLMLTIELSVLLGSFFVLHLQHPPSIRLLDTTTHKFPSDPSFTPSRSTSARSSPAPGLSIHRASEPDLFSTLSLSSKPVVASATLNHPVFGIPSFLPTPPPDQSMDDNDDDDPNSMDWTPTDPSGASKSTGVRRKPAKDADDGSWLRPQRFFPPEQPTGLEGLFARTLLVDDAENEPRQKDGSRPPRRLRFRFSWMWVGALALIPLLGIAYRLWERWNITFTHTGATAVIVTENPLMTYESIIEAPLATYNSIVDYEEGLI